MVKRYLNNISETESTALVLSEITSFLFDIGNYLECVIDKTSKNKIEGYDTSDIERCDLPIYIVINIIVLQLYKFIKISHKLHLIEKNTFSNSELLAALQDLREIIMKDKEKVELWRNELVVHSENQAKSYEPLFKKDHDYQNSIQNFILQSRLLVRYIIIFFHELPAELCNLSWHTREINNKVQHICPKEWWPEMLKHEKKIVEDTNRKLKRAGFDVTLIEKAQKPFR